MRCMNGASVQDAGLTLDFAAFCGYSLSDLVSGLPYGWYLASDST
jgi:hypothetical protein